MSNHLARRQEDAWVRYPEDVVRGRDHEFEVAIQVELSRVGEHCLSRESRVTHDAHRYPGILDLLEYILDPWFHSSTAMGMTEDLFCEFFWRQAEFQSVDVFLGEPKRVLNVAQGPLVFEFGGDLGT